MNEDGRTFIDLFGIEHTIPVQIIIQFNGTEEIIPINPEGLSITRKATNTDIDVLGIGKATRKGDPGLVSTKIKSFFPSSNSEFYTGTSPKFYIEFINQIWNTENTNNNVPKIITQGLEKNLNMFFVIENFTYDYKAGDDDVSFELSIKEYIPYGVKLVDYPVLGMADSRVTSPSIVQNSPVDNLQLNTYTVQSGDCLWNITKACCGDGSKYLDLYILNKDIIGDNPNNIKVGQVLTLPQGWNTPTKVTKLKNVSKSNPPSSGKSSGTSNNASKPKRHYVDAGTILSNAKSIGYTNSGSETGDSGSSINPFISDTTKAKNKNSTLNNALNLLSIPIFGVTPMILDTFNTPWPGE